MVELQQSLLYGQYLQQLGWRVVVIDQVNIFVKHFPFLGGLAKIQRPKKLPSLPKLVPALKQARVRTIAIEPASHQTPPRLKNWSRKLAKYFHLHRSPFLPTKTIVIDLASNLDQVWQRFNSSKRRALRRAQKNNVLVKESSDIQTLIKIKNKSAGLFGFITTSGLKQLWNVFAPAHAAILLASLPPPQQKLVGGVLLVFWDKTAYYWIVAATRQGKKLFAPSLLVWEALKLAKHRGCLRFDFVGVWDERLPQANISWKGFTKFKEGFGGQARYYPLIY